MVFTAPGVPPPTFISSVPVAPQCRIGFSVFKKVLRDCSILFFLSVKNGNTVKGKSFFRALTDHLQDMISVIL